jgi:hypothetical protein
MTHCRSARGKWQRSWLRKASAEAIACWSCSNVVPLWEVTLACMRL